MSHYLSGAYFHFSALINFPSDLLKTFNICNESTHPQNKPLKDSISPQVYPETPQSSDTISSKTSTSLSKAYKPRSFDFWKAVRRTRPEPRSGIGQLQAVGCDSDCEDCGYCVLVDLRNTGNHCLVHVLLAEVLFGRRYGRRR